MIRKSSGFTLVELLTVIAIIGLLAGILIPTVGGVMDKAKEVKVKNQITQLATAIRQYHSNYHYYPLSYDVDDRDMDITVRGDNPDDVEDYIDNPANYSKSEFTFDHVYDDDT